MQVRARPAPRSHCGAGDSAGQQSATLHPGRDARGPEQDHHALTTAPSTHSNRPAATARATRPRRPRRPRTRSPTGSLAPDLGLSPARRPSASPGSRPPDRHGEDRQEHAGTARVAGEERPHAAAAVSAAPDASPANRVRRWDSRAATAAVPPAALAASNRCGAPGAPDRAVNPAVPASAVAASSPAGTPVPTFRTGGGRELPHGVERHRGGAGGSGHAQDQDVTIPYSTVGQRFDVSSASPAGACSRRGRSGGPPAADAVDDVTQPGQQFGEAGSQSARSGRRIRGQCATPGTCQLPWPATLTIGVARWTAIHC